MGRTPPRRLDRRAIFEANFGHSADASTAVRMSINTSRAGPHNMDNCCGLIMQKLMPVCLGKVFKTFRRCSALGRSGRVPRSSGHLRP
eukprot:5500124-Pyramimonas_sp.AAC.1